MPIPFLQSGTCRVLPAFAFILAFLATASAQQASDAIQPETGHDRAENRLVTAKSQMVAAAHPQASAAGIAMLEKGGTAADAMIAVQLVLGLVEPQSSGLGGGLSCYITTARMTGLLPMMAVRRRQWRPMAVCSWGRTANR